MSALESHQEVIQHSFYDTLLSPDVPALELEDKGRFGNALFNQGQRLGYRYLTNMVIVGGLPRTAKFQIERVRMRAWFEADHQTLWGRLYPMLESGVVLTVTTGVKIAAEVTFTLDRKEYDLKDTMTDEARDLVRGRVATFVHEFKAPVVVEEREMFCAEAFVSPVARAAIHALPGRKFLRFHLDGVLVRSLQ